ncbi:MAG: nuclear transport factor 2 family protein [Pseudomonadales bacterium]
MTDDIVAIEQLLNRYCHKLDQGDVEAVVGLFAADAVLIPEYEGSGEHAGRDAIRAWYTNYGRTVGGATRGLRHKISTVAIEVTGDRATSACYLDADSLDARTGQRSLAGGRYLDRLVRQDGVWLLQERRIVVDYASTLPAP